jgi:chromosome segregation ATPase
VALRANAAELEQRAATPVEDEDAAIEVEELEERLRERGHVIAALQRDLREAERVGRELVGELEAARSFVAEPADAAEAPAREPTVPASLVLDLTTRLDALAQSAANTEADLVAARWRVAQLEREADHARTAATRERDERERTHAEALAAAATSRADLERALADARDELARAGDASDAALQEQSALLHQAATALADR